MKSPLHWLGNDSNLVSQNVGELAPSQVALPEALDVGRSVGQLPWTAVPGVGVDQSHTKAQVVPHVPHRPREVRIVGHDNRLLILPVEPVHQKTSGEVHVGPLLLRVPGQDVRERPLLWVYKRTALDAGPEDSIVDV